MAQDQPIPVESDDDEAFIALVRSIVHSVTTMTPDLASRDLYVVKIDNWFDAKWLHFMGKCLGAFGFRLREPHASLVIPPFDPNRVRWQIGPSDAPLHRDMGATEVRLLRRVSRVVPDAVMFWFSGNSAPNGRASCMTYAPTQDGYWTWHAGFKRESTWQPTRLTGISREQLRRLAAPAKAGSA